MSATGATATSGDAGSDPTKVSGATNDAASASAAVADDPTSLAAVLRILAIDPGSSGTKIALVTTGPSRADASTVAATLPAAPAPPGAPSPDLDADLAARLASITDWLAEQRIDPTTLDAVVGRGGLLAPLTAGTYRVNDAMVADLRAGARGRHAANLGGLLAAALADPAGIPAFVVDPVSVDEFAPAARVAGIAALERRSLVHALNIRAVARRDCAARGVRLADANLVVAHLGTGFSIVAIEKGRIVDANNAHEEGPFTPERCGGLPSVAVAGLVFSGRLPDAGAVHDFLHLNGGLRAYLGTGDLVEIERRIDAGDRYAADVLDAMAYQIGKAIGSYAAVLGGRVDAILLTGGVAHCLRVVAGVTPLVDWIAPVRCYPGEDEVAALAAGAARALRGDEQIRDYPEGRP